MAPVQCKHPRFVKKVYRKEQEPRFTHQFASRGTVRPKRNANKTVVICLVDFPLLRGAWGVLSEAHKRGMSSRSRFDTFEYLVVGVGHDFINSLAQITFISSAWVTTIASGSMHAFGMVPAVLGNRFGFANVIIFGGIICVGGLFSSSFVAGNVYPLYITYGLVWGFGSCLCYCSALFVLPKFFRARIGLANGIVFLGGPVGSLVLSAVVQKLVKSVGLAKTFQVLAGLQLTLVLCGFVTRLIFSCSQEPANFNTDKNFGFDWSIFKNKGYVTLVVALSLFMLAYLVPYVHLVG